MDTIFYLIAFCVIASIIAIWVVTSDRHLKAPLSTASTKSSKQPADLVDRSASEAATEKSPRKTMLLTMCCLWMASGLSAQEVIHAVSGTVKSVSAAGKTITLTLDDGSSRQFQQMPHSARSMSFDKTLQAQSTAATELHQLGQHVIMFYYGYDDLTTAVAFLDIGQSDSKPLKGNITQYDRHQHVLTLKDAGAQPQKVTVNQKTVVDTADGAVDGLSYHPAKGRRILVVASSGGTEQTALFISPFE